MHHRWTVGLTVQAVGIHPQTFTWFIAQNIKPSWIWEIATVGTAWWMKGAGYSWSRESIRV